MTDFRALRRDFPVLERKVRGGKPLIYLDNAATSQKPRAVIDALVNYYENYNANIHRGIHTLSEEATIAYEEARGKVAKFIGAPDPVCTLFTRNATEALNLVARTWGEANVGPGDEIVYSYMEHHSNLVPWQMLAQQKGATLRFIELTPDGQLDWESVERAITPRTKIVSVTQMSNVLGTINPIARIAELAHRNGAILVVDGAQSVPHLPVDVEALGCDFLAFSSHKMLGPTGVGVLWGRKELLEAMPPFMGGGDMILQVWIDKATWNELPWKFEAGTPNVADVIALGAAVDYLTGLGMDKVREHEIQLTAYALKVLGDMDGVTIYGPRDAQQRGGLVAFNVDKIHPHDLGTILDQEGIAIRAGHHCCQPLMRLLDVAATGRASFSVYNVAEEIDALAAGIRRAQEVFARVAHR